MPVVPVQFLRGLVGVIAIGCAYMLARAIVAMRKGQVKISRVYAWLLRCIVCLLAVWYPERGLTDTADIVVWSLAAVAFAAGYWDASREKKQEDLTHEIFPEEKP